MYRLCEHFILPLKYTLVTVTLSVLFCCVVETRCSWLIQSTYFAALHRSSFIDALINKSINEWRKRLEAVVKNNGGHIEHTFQIIERFYCAVLYH